MYVDGVRSPRAWSSARAAVVTVTVAVAVGLLALMFSSMLGFGVNERCTAVASCATAACPPCDRLDNYALVHAGVQAGLASIAVTAGIATARRATGRHAVA